MPKEFPKGMPRVPRRITNCSGCGAQLQTTVFYCDLCEDVFCRDCVILIDVGMSVFVCISCTEQQYGNHGDDDLDSTWDNLISHISSWTTTESKPGAIRERWKVDCSVKQKASICLAKQGSAQLSGSHRAENSRKQINYSEVFMTQIVGVEGM
eukprot:5083853-Karenia_brevis.AAC.1